MIINDRLTKAQQSGKSDKDLQLLIDQSVRKEAEKIEDAERFEGNLSRQKALRLARAASERLTRQQVGGASATLRTLKGGADRTKPKS